jgi:uncharacterized protein involved in exopolysaccharide biosynthesis
MTAPPVASRQPTPMSSGLFDWDDIPAGISISALVETARRWRHVLVGGVLIGAALGVVVALTRPPTYTSEAVFYPEGQRPPSQTNAIAAQFGVQVGALGIDALNSAQIYPELILTRSFLLRVASEKYPTITKDSATLIDMFGGSERNDLMRRKRAIDRLARSIEVEAAQRTGIVTVAAHAVSPQLAEAVTQRILDEVAMFNVQRRQTRARAERRFVERRLEEIGSELRRKEDQLQSFLQQNRDFTRAPELTLAHTRLDREVGLSRQLYASLAQSYEQAKIEEVRDTPVITILSAPEFPVQPDPRGRIRIVLFGMLIGLAAGGVLAVILERRRQGLQSRHSS